MPYRPVDQFTDSHTSFLDARNFSHPNSKPWCRGCTPKTGSAAMAPSTVSPSPSAALAHAKHFSVHSSDPKKTSLPTTIPSVKPSAYSIHKSWSSQKFFAPNSKATLPSRGLLSLRLLASEPTHQLALLPRLQRVRKWSDLPPLVSPPENDGAPRLPLAESA